LANAGQLLRFVDYLIPGPRSRQVRPEFNAWLALMRELDIRSYLEVGAYRGGTFYRVMRHLPQGSLGVTVDDDRRSKSRGAEPPLARVKGRLTRMGYKIETVVGDSHDPKTVAATRKLGPFDAVLIDADHAYAAVKQDWADYSPMARRMIALHDIAEDHVTRRGHPVEVARLWREVKTQGHAHEFIAPGSKMGIGVLVIDRKSGNS
jgi:hypothetical protein